MKNSALFSILSLLVLLNCLCARSNAQTLYGNEKEAFFADFYVMETKPMQFLVTYQWPIMDRVGMRILDQNGQVLFVEKALVYKKYRKVFDLSKFGDGRYTFELTDGANEFSKSFQVATRVFRTALIRNKDEGNNTLLHVR